MSQKLLELLIDSLSFVNAKYVVFLFIRNETGEAFSFIGLERPAMGHYKWSDGSVPKYLYMITQESDFINPKCGVILMEDAFGPVLKLSLDTCDTARPYVCQKFIGMYSLRHVCILA